MSRSVLAIAVLLLASGVACGQGREAQTGESDDPPSRRDAAADDSAGIPPSARPDTPAAAAVPSPAGDAMTMTVPGDTAIQGMVRAAGAVPTAQIVIQSGAGASATRVAVAGPLRAELGKLVGAEVRVWGKPVANRPPPPSRAVEVSRYEIVTVNGRNPYVGVLERRGDGMWLNSEKVVKLAIVPAELEAASGATVWILGSLRDGELVVDSYGIIKSP